MTGETKQIGYPVLEVASYILGQTRSSDDTWTPMKLIKVVYFAHGWTLGLLGRPLIQEKVVAWLYGPVIEVLYEHTKPCRYKRVNNISVAMSDELKNDTEARGIIDQTTSNYGTMSAFALSVMTHRERSPWHKVMFEDGVKHRIPNEDIQKYFKDRGKLLSTQAE